MKDKMEYREASDLLTEAKHKSRKNGEWVFATKRISVKAERFGSGWTSYWKLDDQAVPRSTCMNQLRGWRK